MLTPQRSASSRARGGSVVCANLRKSVSASASSRPARKQNTASGELSRKTKNGSSDAAPNSNAKLFPNAESVGRSRKNSLSVRRAGTSARFALSNARRSQSAFSSAKFFAFAKTSPRIFSGTTTAARPPASTRNVMRRMRRERSIATSTAPAFPREISNFSSAFKGFSDIPAARRATCGATRFPDQFPPAGTLRQFQKAPFPQILR